ncbi:hypothetical protein AB0K24_53980, partial [Streptomyces mirabilis]|uniref:hypothetical protein n=1 Tax=Streptomyces mirabilis TaxID=68239 RepID=UPI003427A054
LVGVADLHDAEREMVDAGEHLLEGQAEFVQAADAVWVRTSSCSCRCRPREPISPPRQFHTVYGNSGKVLPYVVWKSLLGHQAPHIACM